ncbi:MAG: HAMP domain-containing protein [Acidobacteria bacterium]|nr:HAMP domain-containing protein [Acidobacteriota bacterium]
MDRPTGSAPPPRIPLALAGLAAVVAVVPGRWAALLALLLALAALAAVVATAVRRRPLTAWAALLAATVVAATLVEVLPAPEPAQAIAAATARVGAAWQDAVARLEEAVREPPPAGSDFGWLEQRCGPLGPGSGLAVLDARLTQPLAWSGWTTPLHPEEREELLQRLQAGHAALVLRRGLALRLVVARRGEQPPGLVVSGEIALPPEPRPGFLAARVGPGVSALVYWDALGEGVRGSAGWERPDGEETATPFWSLVPLVVRGAPAAGRVSLQARPPAEIAAELATRRRAVAAVALALLATGAALFGRGWPVLQVLLARAVLLPVVPHDAPRVAGWLGGDPGGLVGLFARPVATAVDAALTALALAALALVAPVPARREARHVAAALAGAGGLVGAWLAGPLTVGLALAPVEPLRPGPLPLQGACAGLALVGLAWAGLTYAARCLAPNRARAAIAGACAAGLLAGAAHGAAVDDAAARVTRRELVPEIQERRATWERALDETLDLTLPSPGQPVLEPQWDAIDLWWSGPLGEAGLASGVWKFGPDGALEDFFSTGLPPVEPEPELPPEPLPRAVGSRPLRRGPEPVQQAFLGSTIRLQLAEVQRPGGGTWVVAVLDQPDNLPSRSAQDPLRGMRAAHALQSGLFPAAGDLAPRLAWFDQSGRLRQSDLDAAPPSPRAPPPRPLWHAASIEGRRALVLDIPDVEGTISAVVFPPGPLAVASIAVGWGLVLAALAALLCGARALATTPRPSLVRGWLAARRWLRLFQVQIGAALIAAGLLVLLALGIATRAVAHRQAAHELMREGGSAVHFAQRFLEDYLVEQELSDVVVAWLARTLGDDLFTWDGGQLVATSRRDLVRAGIVPERLDGETWQQVAIQRVPLALHALYPAAPPRVAAHAPFRAQPGTIGALSVPLGRASQRIAFGLAEVDRALLVSSALLVALTGLLIVPATRRLVRPLSELEAATARLAGGQFDAPVPERGYEEARALARAFREMASSLAAQQRTLQRRRELIEALIATMPLAVVATRADGSVWAANPRARELLGAEPGRPLAGAGPLAAAALRLVSGAGAGSRSEDVADGSALLRLSAEPLPRQTEDEPALLLVVEDLSDAVRSERLAAWAEMARRIAHEIKNPLTPISLVVEHVRRLAATGDPALPELLDRMLETVSEQVRVLRDTAREFSDYARLLEARPEPLAIPALVREWLAPYLLAPPPGVAVRAEGPEELPPIPADARLLRRALVNLVDNALAAVGAAGHVTVRWGRRPGEDAIEIAVEDDGPGIEPARVPHLFDAGTTTRETGTGLGLAIARQSVEAHGGRIEVETELGRGARFTIVLPRS